MCQLMYGMLDRNTRMPFFVFGMKLREKKEWFLYRVSIILIVFVQFIMFGIYQMTVSKGTVIFKVINLISHYGANIFGALMSFFVLQWIGSKINWKNNKLFTMFSKHSMTIYLFHNNVA